MVCRACDLVRNHGIDRIPYTIEQAIVAAHAHNSWRHPRQHRRAQHLGEG